MAGNVCRQLGVHPVSQAIIPGQFHRQHEAVTADLSNGLADFHQQAAAAGQSAAVAVVAQVGVRRQKLVKDVTVPRRHLDAGVTATLQAPGGVRRGFYKCRQIVRRQFFWHGVEQIVRQGGSAAQAGHAPTHAPSPAVVLNLGQQMAVLFANGLGKTA